MSILLATAALSRVLGPLILVPMILTAWMILVQTNPDRFMRRFSLAAGMLLMVAPLVLELAGILPSSYVFEDGKLITLPQMIELPRFGTFAFVSVANVGIALAPAVFVARLRAELSSAQEREVVGAWRLRRLPEELMHASPR